MATPTLRADSPSVTHLNIVDAIAEPVGVARALSRALNDLILDESDRAWLEVALGNQLDRATAILTGKTDA